MSCGAPLPLATLELPLDELALRVLTDYRDNAEWNWGNWMRQAQQYGYRARPDAVQALAEAWAWVLNHGLAVRNFAQSSEHAVLVSRQGHAFLERGAAWLRAVERLDVDLVPALERTARPQFLRGDFETAPTPSHTSRTRAPATTPARRPGLLRGREPHRGEPLQQIRIRARIIHPRLGTTILHGHGTTSLKEIPRAVVRVDEDLRAFLRTQQVLGADVHRHQLIRNARPIPPTEHQVAAKPPIEVTAWIVWGRDGLELVDTTAQAWAGRDVQSPYATSAGRSSARGSLRRTSDAADEAAEAAVPAASGLWRRAIAIRRVFLRSAVDPRPSGA